MIDLEGEVDKEKTGRGNRIRGRYFREDCVYGSRYMKTGI